MAFALILTSVACVVLLYLLMSKTNPQPTASLQGKVDVEAKARSAAESELEKKRRELDEQRAAFNEVKDQLKQAKRKLFDQKSSATPSNDLAVEREKVERSASVQLENTRAELSAALAELHRVKADADAARTRRTAPVAEAPVTEAPRAPAPAPLPVQRVIRELSDADKEKIQRLEAQSAKDRSRALEVERELKRVRGRVDTQTRVFTSTRSELDLVKDKYKALEKRLNRTLLQGDLFRRAIKDLEKKSGVAAENTELSAAEIADSDRSVDERQQAEQRAADERLAAANEAERVATAAREAASTREAAAAASGAMAEAEPVNPGVVQAPETASQM